MEGRENERGREGWRGVEIRGGGKGGVMDV